MATKKSTPKKNTSKTTNKKSSNKRSSTSSRGTASKNTKRNSRSVEEIRTNNQIKAIVLLALAVILAALVLLPGENVWKGLHNFLMGTFGGWAIFWPVLLGYSAVTMALEKFQGEKGGLRKKIIMCVTLIFIICTAVFIYSDIPFPNGLDYFRKLGFLYSLGISNRGAALCGGLFGIPILLACGKTAAKILITVILVVSVMILFKITISSIAEALEKGARAAKKTAITARERQRERAEIRREERQILIDNPPPKRENKEEEQSDFASGLSFDHPVFSEPNKRMIKGNSNSVINTSEIDISVETDKRGGRKKNEELSSSKNDIYESFGMKDKLSESDASDRNGNFVFHFSDEALSKVPPTPTDEGIPTGFGAGTILINRETGEVIENTDKSEEISAEPTALNQSAEKVISESVQAEDDYATDYQFEDLSSDSNFTAISEEEPVPESEVLSEVTEDEETDSIEEETETKPALPVNDHVNNSFNSALREEKQESAVVTPIDLSDESLDNAKQAAEEYMEKREEAEKAEIASKAEMSLYDQHKDDEKTYIFPPVTLLRETEKLDASVETEELQTNGKVLIDTLASFGVKSCGGGNKN